jgi:hypothetical protein
MKSLFNTKNMKWRFDWLLIAYIVVSYRTSVHQPIQSKIFANEKDAKVFMKMFRGTSKYPQIDFNRCDRTASVVPVTDVPCENEAIHE